MSKKIYYSWENMERDCVVLAKELEREYRPTHIVGISRGGLVPAVWFSHWFEATFSTIDWSLRDTKVPIDFEGIARIAETSHLDKYLIVDDICDSGETFKQIRERLEFFNTNMTNVKFLSLWADNAKYTDYWARNKNQDQWCVFPWEEPLTAQAVIIVGQK